MKISNLCGLEIFLLFVESYRESGAFINFAFDFNGAFIIWNHMFDNGES